MILRVLVHKKRDDWGGLVGRNEAIGGRLVVYGVFVYETGPTGTG